MAWRLFGSPSSAATGSGNLVLQTGQVTQFPASRLIPCAKINSKGVKKWIRELNTNRVLTFKQPKQKVCEQGRYFGLCCFKS